MKIKIWGPRGSIPSPHPSTVRYGGNTSCVSIEIGDQILILDAGTGIRELGKVLAATKSPIYLLITHAHWDHIQGFPFFIPLYQPDRKIHMLQAKHDDEMFCALLDQMDGAHFPVTPANLLSDNHCIKSDPMEYLQDHGFLISSLATNHPGGGFGYRIEQGGRSVVYMPDNELHPPGNKVTEFDAFAAFCQNADVLIHDAQYLESDMPHKHGWGHSLVGQTCELAAAARVKHLILFHHDPDRTDDEIDTIQANARAWFQQQNQEIQVTAAYEGLTLD